MLGCDIPCELPCSLTAQSDPPAAVRRPSPFVRASEGVEFSVGTFAQVTGSRNPGSTTNDGTDTVSQQVSQSATPSPGVLGSVRQSFGPWLGYTANVGYTRFTENYTSGTVVASVTPPFGVLSQTFARGSIGTNAVELTGSYLVHARRGRYTPFVQLGGGMVVFVPTPTTQPVSYVYRGTGLFGVGLSYRVNPRVELRAEYRGLFFKSPDFRYGQGGAVPSAPIPVTQRYTVTQEPTLSITYRFGGPKHGLQ